MGQRVELATQSGASNPTYTGALGTGLGTAQNMAFSAASDQYLIGLLNGSLTVTLTAYPAKSRGFLIVQQDSTGGRTLTVVAGANSTTVNIPQAASGPPILVRIDSVDGTAAGVIATLDANPDASTAIKGAVLLDTAPTVATTPTAVGSNSPWISQSVYLTANATAVNNSTAFINAGGLTFNIGSSATEVWEAEFWVLINGTSTMDAQFQLATAPSGATAYGGLIGGTSGGWTSAGTSGTPSNAAGFATAVQVGMPTSGTTGVALKWVIFGGGTSGAIQLQYAQVTATAANLQVLAGSFLKYRKLHV